MIFKKLERSIGLALVDFDSRFDHGRM